MPEEGGFSFDMSGMAPLLNAMMSRYGQYMDLGLQQAEEERPRRREAFDLFTREKESGLEEAELRREMAKREAMYARQRELAQRKEASQAKAKKQQDKMAANLRLGDPGGPLDPGGVFRRGPSGSTRMDPTMRQLLQAQATGAL